MSWLNSTSVTAIEREQDTDSDIEVIACYREAPVFPPELAGGRAMTFDLDTCGEEGTQHSFEQPGSISSLFDPSDSLVEWFVESPPSRTYTANDHNHRMANCSHLEPIPYSPMSPPLTDQGPSGYSNYDQLSEDLQQANFWMSNPHFTGLAISASGLCGELNYIQQGDCTVCGISFATLQEEITLGYLEKTQVAEETYAQRIRKRNAFLAGMTAGIYPCSNSKQTLRLNRIAPLQ